MKVAVTTSAMPNNPTADQDFTDAIFDSDVKGGFVIGSGGVTNGTIRQQARLAIGVIDGTSTHRSLDFADEDAVTSVGGQDVRARLGESTFINYSNAGADLALATATGSIISNGIRATWTTWSGNNELLNALILGGSDVEMAVSSATMNGTTDVNVTHGLTGTPDIIMCLTHGVSSVTTGNAICASIGFYDVAHNTYVCSSVHRSAGSATTSLNAQLSDNCVAAKHTASAVWKATLNDVGATTFDIVANAAATDIVRFISLRITGGEVKLGTFLTKTTTGTQADITGMGLSPKAVIYLPTFITSANSLNTIIGSSTCESYGVGVAANNFGVTQQAAAAVWSDDGVVLGNPTPTSNTKSVNVNNKAGYIFDGTGALSTDWSISSWDAGGITNNYSNVAGTARFVGYVALASSTTIVPILNANRFRSL